MSLVSAFLVAAALVSPFAVITLRRVWRDRVARRAPTLVEHGSPEPIDPRDISVVIAVIHDQLESAPPSPGASPLELPIPEASIGGRPAEPRIVAALITDDLRRRGIDANLMGDTLHIGRATG